MSNSLLKRRRTGKLFKTIDDKYAKDSVCMLVTFEDLINNRKIIEEIRKEGYKFSIVFNKNIPINKQDRGIMYVAEYLFMDKKTVNTAEILSYIPEDMTNKIIYENITDKVGGFGGEDE